MRASDAESEPTLNQGLSDGRRRTQTLNSLHQIKEDGNAGNDFLQTCRMLTPAARLRE